MKKVFAVLGILVVVLAAYLWYSFKGGKKREKGPKPVALTVSKHSPVFNASLQEALDAYYGLSEAFVTWDTAAISRQGNSLQVALANVQLDELKEDTTGIYETALDPLANAKNETANIISNTSIDAQRTAFNNLSENLRLLFIVVKYDQGKLYWQECPMAFGDERPGFWISKTDDVRNPYLGTSHPKYKDGMLKCGGPKDTINFMQPGHL